MLKEQGAGKEEGLFLMVFSFPAPSWGAGPPPSLATLSSVARCRATMGRPVPGPGGPEAQVCWDGKGGTGNTGALCLAGTQWLPRRTHRRKDPDLRLKDVFLTTIPQRRREKEKEPDPTGHPNGAAATSRSCFHG